MNVSGSLGTVPFEKQINDWSCGAAALAMVYQSFGIQCCQEPIWEAIAGKNQWGRPCARAQSLASDALQRGLHALAIQVRDPWLVLERGIRHSVRLIINHEPQPKSGSGHYSVLTDLSEHEVVVHDPGFGPNRVLARDDFLKLWNPSAPNTQIVSQVLVAIADASSTRAPCPLCQRTALENVTCFSCQRSIPLQPTIVLGCLADCCPMRAWEQIFCPYCDCVRRHGI